MQCDRALIGLSLNRSNDRIEWINDLHKFTKINKCVTFKELLADIPMDEQQGLDPNYGFGSVRAERWNGRFAMIGLAIGLLTEVLTGQGILHQLGLF